MIVGILFAQHVLSTNSCHDRVLVSLELLDEKRSDKVAGNSAIFDEVVPMLILILETYFYLFGFCYHPEPVVMRVARVFKGTYLDITETIDSVLLYFDKILAQLLSFSLKLAE
jgi:hypothetical protein